MRLPCFAQREFSIRAADCPRHLNPVAHGHTADAWADGIHGSCRVDPGRQANPSYDVASRKVKESGYTRRKLWDKIEKER